jgi:large repetitive protein
MAGTTNGTVVSFANTPQAKDDILTPLTEDTLGKFTFDVMANDLGGNAKSLWSLDDGAGASPTDLLQQDTVHTEALSSDRSKLGAVIWITADGKIGYDATPLQDALQKLAVGEYAIDSFTYAIRMGNGALSWATATLRIDGVNDAPVITSTAAAAAGSVQEDSALTAIDTLSASDIDNGATLAWSVQGSASGTYGGIAVDVASGQWTYTLDNGTNGVAGAVQSLAAGESHDEVFTIRVSDGLGGYADQQVTITVNGTNDAPVGVADTLSATEDVAVTYSAAALLANDTDIDTSHSALHITSVANGTGGTVVLNADGSVIFTPTADFNGPATFAYSVSDGMTNSVAMGNVTVNVAAVNDAPVNTVPGALSTNQNTAKPITGLAVNDVDAGTGQITTSLSVAHGTLTAAAAGGANVTGNGTGVVTIAGTLSQVNATLAAAISYMPVSGFAGNDTLTMLTSDNGNNGAGGPQSDMDTVAISVTASNHSPLAGNDMIVVSSHTTGITIPLAALLANDTDSDGDALSIINVGNPSSSVLSGLDISGGNVIFNTGNGDTPQSFSYTLSDGTVTSTGTVAVNFIDTKNGVGQPDSVNLSNIQYTGYAASYVDLQGGNDTAIGGGMALDAFIGGNGNDLLVGGSGSDTLTGGSGADVFRFNTALNSATNVDTIPDFEANGTDHIQLSASIFASLSGSILASANFAANVGGNAVDGNDYILYDTSTGNLYYDGDGNGDGSKTLFAKLTGVTGAVDNTDFVLI